ncbi:alpha/beta hydrolase [Rhabdobacter roseus]|uniref:Pimeloyl-ACP methyl ester carboxylesterase n=1 Tax=Rhabdobacter roseus TaxID=1655419 RepID=A0A840TCV7_9BACT|nr:alpha/beta hydrolase [Rhabdobacter roseus]MBB5281906.1 pimeloyl-ACP methyl ester carboxylesterase [Rhabdobacter roseus]
MKTIHSKTVLFVTGAFVSHRGWDSWKTYFESQGYTALAPAWPHKDGIPAELRKNPDLAVAALGLTQVVDYYADIIRQLPEKPIVIGHSLGGLITQLLVQRGLAAAGVAIHSVPPQGVFSFSFSFYKATWNPLGFFKSARKPYVMSFKEWQYAFTNGMSLEEQRSSYEASVIPESRRALRGGLSAEAKIDFKKPHVPLLFVAGSEDYIMPAELNYANFKRYRHAGSVTEFKKFEGRNHYVLGLPTWQENVDYILNWIGNH